MARSNYTADGFGDAMVQRANLDGSDIETLYNMGLPTGIVVDPKGCKVYWADALSLTIMWANLDGTEVEPFLNTTSFPGNLALRFDVPSATATESQTGTPDAFALHSGYPNPFRASTTIAYTLPEPDVVHVRVYDVLIQQVAGLVDGMQDPGIHEVVCYRSGQPAELYLVKIYLERGEQAVQTVTKGQVE